MSSILQRLSDYSNLMLEQNQRQRRKLRLKWEQRSRLTSRPREKLLLLQKPILSLKLSLKLMLNQKPNLKLMSRARQMLMQKVKQMRKEKQIGLGLVRWANQAATLILSITIVNNLLEEDIKLMLISGLITTQVA